MTILITGGTGKTGGILARKLHAANYTFVVTTRTGRAPEPFRAVKFDWLDASTFKNPFKADQNIDRVYLIMPPAFDILPIVAPFIDLAIAKQVKRFVLLTSVQSEAGGVAHGKVHQYLLDKGVDYAVLKPSWFIQNFSTSYLKSITENNEIVTATGDGKIPWISSEDIAQAAFNDLTADKSPNKEYYVLGPDLYSFDEAVKLLSSVIGREITHKKVTFEEQCEAYKKSGISDDFAAAYAGIEGLVAVGKEAAVVDAPADRKYIGKHTMEQFFRESSQVWTK